MSEQKRQKQEQKKKLFYRNFSPQHDFFLLRYAFDDHSQKITQQKKIKVQSVKFFNDFFNLKFIKLNLQPLALKTP